MTVRPNNTLTLWQIPDGIYTVTGEYYKVPHKLAANTDTLAMPARFHMIVVWKALMHYGAYAGAGEKYDHGEREYKRIRAMLEFSELEDTTYGEPLA